MGASTLGTTRLTNILPSVVGGQHGREFLRHWRSWLLALQCGLCRWYPRLPVFQPPRCHDRLLLLLLWSRVRSAPDGTVSLLVRLVAREVQ